MTEPTPSAPTTKSPSATSPLVSCRVTRPPACLKPDRLAAERDRFFPEHCRDWAAGDHGGTDPEVGASAAITRVLTALAVAVVRVRWSSTETPIVPLQGGNKAERRKLQAEGAVAITRPDRLNPFVCYRVRPVRWPGILPLQREHSEPGATPASAGPAASAGRVRSHAPPPRWVGRSR